MKTPRELLFERHRAAETELDSLRHAVVETLNSANERQEMDLSLTPRFSRVEARPRTWTNRFSGFLAMVRRPASLPSALLSMAQNGWRELILPCRGIWMALAATWVVIFGLAFASRDTSPTIAENAPPPSPEIITALQNQKRLLAEMLLDSAKTSDTDRPKPSRPSPRSELVMPAITT